MHAINFETYSRRDTLLSSIILQIMQTNLLETNIHNNALECSRNTEVDMDTQRNIIIPFQFKEQFLGNLSLSLQNSVLICIFLPPVFIVIYFKFSPNTSQINYTYNLIDEFFTFWPGNTSITYHFLNKTDFIQKHIALRIAKTSSPTQWFLVSTITSGWLKNYSLKEEFYQRGSDKAAR